jgi:LacI family transcriptional regulator
MTQGRPTVYDVADEAGVSIATVSRYFSNPDAVAARTRDRVSAAVTALGYVQNSAARRLAGGNNETIALCLPDFDEPDTPLNLSASDGTVATVRGEDAFGAGADGLFFGEIIRGVEVEARRLGTAVTIVIGRVGDPELDARLRRLMGRVDGVVAVAGSLSGPQVEMLARQMPVALTSDAGSEPGVDHVRTDNDAGMYAMTSHLLETHALRRPVFLAGPEESPDSSVRFDAYRRSLADHGLPVPDVPDLSGDFTRTAGRHMGVRLLSQGLSGQDDAPDAIVCANDQTALGVMDVLGPAGDPDPRGRGRHRVRRHRARPVLATAPDHRRTVDGGPGTGGLRPARRTDRRAAPRGGCCGRCGERPCGGTCCHRRAVCALRQCAHPAGASAAARQLRLRVTWAGACV